MDVRTAMDPAAIPVEAATPLEHVADLMRARGADVLPVTDHGEFVGLVTARDVLLSLAAPPAVAGVLPTQMMRTLPSHGAAWIAADAPVTDAAHLMATLHVDALAVLDDGAVVGLIRLCDLAPLLHGPMASAWESTTAIAGRATRGVVGASRRAIGRVAPRHNGDGSAHHGDAA